MNENERQIAEKAWAEGHQAGAEDSGERLRWCIRAQNPPYTPGPLPELTRNPYQRENHQ